MEIGIAFPKIIPAGRSERVMEWAVRADEGPFSSLALIDRIVYATHESLIVLAAAAAVTDRIRLMPTVLVSPLRNATLMAKQVATIDAISGGRFSLGIGVGSRPDDFAAVNVSMKARGKLMEEQIATMRRIWSGQPVNENAGHIGPAPARPGGPEILIGGRSAAALERSGRLGDGYVSGSAGSSLTNQVKEVAAYYDRVSESWKASGKPGRPRLVVGMSCGIGAYAAERTRESMRAYYSFRGPSAKTMEVNVPSTPDELREAISAFDGIGADEIILEPGIGDIEQMDRLADIVG